tara:strand:- start:2225 stop:4627 length:2403 start_codon:yes stop_codon:yes gene_type:complete
MINKLKNHIPIILTILTVSGCLEMEINQPPNSETGSSFTAAAEIIFIKDDAADWGRRMIFAVNKPVGWIINSMTYESQEHGEGVFEYKGNNDVDPDCPNCGTNSNWELELEENFPSVDGMHWQMYSSDRSEESTSTEENPDTFHVEIDFTVDDIQETYMLKYFSAFSDLNMEDESDDSKYELVSDPHVVFDPSSTMMVNLSVTDHTWTNENIKMKGTLSNWLLFPANDDGIDGDEVEDDHIWTARYPIFQDGTYSWGAIEDDGSENEISLTEGNDLEFTVVGDAIEGQTNYVIPAETTLYPGAILFTVTDLTENYWDLRWKGTPTGWEDVPMYDNGQNGDEVANDHVWTVVINNITPGDHEWGASEGEVWVINGGNLLFNLEQDMMTVHGHTGYTIQVPSGEPVTKTVLFTVDMTEWLDQEENLGMGMFSSSRGDEVQVRGNFNNWGSCTECTMTRAPGTNVYSIAINVTDVEDSEHKFAYYMDLSTATLEILTERYGVAPVDWIGWEFSPSVGGNKGFNLGFEDGYNIIQLPQHAFYDVLPGAVLEVDESMELTFTVDMTAAAEVGFDSDDIVFLRTDDKWLNYLQGYSTGDGVSHYGATLNDDGTYSYTLTLNGPLPWAISYKWGFTDSESNADIEEVGGGLGGAARIRYLHRNSNNDCNWPATYSFPLDGPFAASDESDAYQEPWDAESVCIALLEVDKDQPLPEQYYISDNYPNPFNPKTKMHITIPVQSDISFNIYSITGSLVYAHSEKALIAGEYELEWNARDMKNNPVASGIYIYEFRAGNAFHITKKMTLLK